MRFAKLRFATRPMVPALLASQLVLAGCALKKPAAPAPAAKPAAAAAQDSNAPAPTGVQISYAHKDDTLALLTVTKYDGVQLIDDPAESAAGQAAIARFTGGVEVWEVKPDTGIGLLKHIGLASDKKYAVAAVKYGAVPANFAQSFPDSGEPEPLQPGHYYVFSVQRASGSFSFVAMKVLADQSLEVYDADPRAGSSYRLCCDISPDFSQSDSGLTPDRFSPEPPDLMP